ncbi:hypothetical protein GCWU000342_00668 [Shuttleworthella satelles DSM 14600]|uniref:Uncharacterized protein n=1 Tax=Shuttleworthella satelles DSM 14600 TaxID=626523 RepID=C4G9L5_9FIRM|nr:hypothetical protein GCWU000342_00668 [Shuttleworthia satelles DSM 14600]
MRAKRAFSLGRERLPLKKKDEMKDRSVSGDRPMWRLRRILYLRQGTGQKNRRIFENPQSQNESPYPKAQHKWIVDQFLKFFETRQQDL